MPCLKRGRRNFSTSQVLQRGRSQGRPGRRGCPRRSRVRHGGVRAECHCAGKWPGTPAGWWRAFRDARPGDRPLRPAVRAAPQKGVEGPECRIVSMAPGFLPGKCEGDTLVAAELGVVAADAVEDQCLEGTVEKPLPVKALLFLDTWPLPTGRAAPPWYQPQHLNRYGCAASGWQPAACIDWLVVAAAASAIQGIVSVAGVTIR
jgi:hypothetical protein